MKKHNAVVIAVLLCSMIIASCASRQFAPISRVTLPAVERSDNKDEYQILNTVEGEVAVSMTQKGSKRIVKPESGNDFVNVCYQDKKDEEKYNYSTKDSKGTLRYGIIENFNNGGEPNRCDGESMARYLAAYRLINEAKTAGADGILAPSVRVDTDELKDGILYRVKISAKLIKLNTAN